MEKFQKYFKEKIENVNNLNHKGNNILFKISLKNKNYLVKQYSTVMGDWNRATSEYNALTFLWEKGFRNIPKPIKIDEKENIAIYSFEEGKIINSKEVKKEDILEAVDFLSNLHKIEDKAFHPARHACLSLMNYLDTLDRRIKPFLEFKPKDEIGLKAKEFLDNKILPKIGELKKNFPKDSSFKKQLELKDQVLTPADFGFHNIILTEKGKYIFLDFEYFGRDDPARQISDFINHDQSRDVKESLKQLFLKEYKEKTNFNNYFEKRLELIDPLIKMTWVLIYLNPLSQTYLKHAQFAHGDVKNLLKERLEKAKIKFKEIQSAN